MIQFIHTADIHFGMENYGKIDPETGIHTRLLDFERAVNFCIDYAIEQEVDFFLFSGDAYKTATPSPTQQRLLINCFLRLHQAHIPVVIVVGNHDHPLSFGKTNALNIFSQLPLDGFYVCDKPRSLLIETKSGPVQIVGIPWPTRNTIALAHKNRYKSATEITAYPSRAVGRIIKKMAGVLDPVIPAGLAGHLTVSSGIFSGSEKRAVYGTDPILLPSQLAIAPFDYVALGHLHRYQNLNPKGYPALIYSGSPERIDFGERKEEKGFCHVRIAKKNGCTHEFIKTPARPFIQLDVKLVQEKDQTQQVLDAIGQHDITDAVVKILYHLPAGLTDRVDLRAVQKALRAAQYVACIMPIRPVLTRERRAGMKVTMSLEHLLSKYFDTKPELADKKQALIQKALQLCQEIENKENLKQP